MRAAGPGRMMSVLWLSVAAILAVSVGPTDGKPAKTSRLAKYTPLCKLSDSNLNECMTKAMENILKHAKTGIPELKIPALEPLLIPEIDLKVFEGLTSLTGNSQKTDKTKAFARNLVVHHSSEFVLNDLKANVENKEFYIDLSFPKLRVEGEYDVNLMMFGMPIKSIGPVSVNATNIDVKATLNGKTMKRKGDTYLMFDSIKIKVNFKDYSIMINNLFKKDQNMNRALNDLIKNQKGELRTLMLPMIEEVAGKMVLGLVNQILTDLPLEEIFITDK